MLISYKEDTVSHLLGLNTLMASVPSDFVFLFMQIPVVQVGHFVKLGVTTRVRYLWGFGAPLVVSRRVTAKMLLKCC